MTDPSTAVPGATAAIGETDAEPGYAAALAELEDILAELDGNDVDVDRLADRVQRAAQLIGLCRQRIGAARMQIEQVVTELDADQAPLA